MSGKLLEKYMSRGGTSDEEETVAGVTEDFGAFGVIRSLRDRAVMIEFHKKTGDILAIGYGFIHQMEYDPSEGIILRSGNSSITIHGRNLNREIRPDVRLFQCLARNRVSWVREAETSAILRAAENEVVIEKLTW